MATSLNPSWLDRALFPFRRLQIGIDGHRIHYVDTGEGPTLLLLHGNGSWSFIYRHIIAELSTQYRCIAVDYPGFGLSQARPGFSYKPADHAAVLEQFIAALDLRDIRLVMHDWGGPIGLSVAQRNTDRISSLFICNTWAWPARDVPHIARFSRIAGSALGRFLITRFNFLISVGIPVLSVTRKLTAAERRAYKGPFPTVASRRPMAIFPKEILASETFLADVEKGLSRLRDKPVTLLWGDADSGFKISELNRFQRHFPSASTTILRGAKHYVQEDAPAEICAAIRQSDTRELHT